MQLYSPGFCGNSAEGEGVQGEVAEGEVAGGEVARGVVAAVRRTASGYRLWGGLE